MITLPWWLSLLILLVTIAVTLWVTLHVTMWAGGRLEAVERGELKEQYPWNWRVVFGAAAYFGWLERKVENGWLPEDG